MSRLIALDPDNQLVDDPEGFEYGYYAFDNIDPIETEIEINEMTNRKGGESPVNLPDKEITLPIEDDKSLNCRKKINSAKTFSIC